MSLNNKEIANRVTGQVIRFIQTAKDTNGELLEMESLYPLFSKEPPVHFHPHQEEYFKVLKGELTVRIGNESRIYRSGATIKIKPGVRHSMWNEGLMDALVNWKVYPAMDTEHFLTTLTQLANTGKTNDTGVPPLPILVFLLKKYNQTFRLAKIPMGVLTVMSILFKPLFKVHNYKNKFNQPLRYFLAGKSNL
ncbi:cupin domain-containing protein [Pedobacter sp. B4-66]|uniref:cupin domain-containing protein n=1 Tax=Pedobacter sp. B4-66 TaxID=2817280 RepID=UPI001BD9746E|nr:cupin domain-containing protein [Pedobacter sp. B4-66]